MVLINSSALSPPIKPALMNSQRASNLTILRRKAQLGTSPKSSSTPTHNHCVAQSNLGHREVSAKQQRTVPDPPTLKELLVERWPLRNGATHSWVGAASG